MPTARCVRAAMALLGPILLFPAAAAAAAPGEIQPHAAAEAPNAGLILELEEGERRVRRSRAAGAAGLTTPFILKVDRQNGGSEQLVMGYEEIAPGAAIRPHRHLLADEIIFVHRGSGIASLGAREAPVGTGGTIYIPRNTRIALRNNGSEPLGIAFIFSAPGFEELMRANSVREGEPDVPLSAEEQRQNAERNRWHTVHEEP